MLTIEPWYILSLDGRYFCALLEDPVSQEQHGLKPMNPMWLVEIPHGKPWSPDHMTKWGQFRKPACHSRYMTGHVFSFDSNSFCVSKNPWILKFSSSISIPQQWHTIWKSNLQFICQGYIVRSPGSPFGYDLCQVGVHYLLRCVGKPGWPGCWIEKFPPAEKTAKNQRIPLENSRWNLPNQFLVGRKPTRNFGCKFGDTLRWCLKRRNGSRIETCQRWCCLKRFGKNLCFLTMQRVSFFFIFWMNRAVAVYMIHYLHDLPEYGGFGQMFFFHRGVIEAIYSRCTYLPLFHRRI